MLGGMNIPSLDAALEDGLVLLDQICTMIPGEDAWLHLVFDGKRDLPAKAQTEADRCR